jgi:fused signal recognition particle receptor
VTGVEIGTLLAALAAIALVIGLVRTSAQRQLREKRRYALDTDDQAPARTRPPAPRAKPKPTPDDDDADVADVAATDAEAAEAEAEAARVESAELRAGLARTRGGFIARLGKLLGKKQIDAALLDELEEVLLTADIGPRTADKLYQSVKERLSRSELEDAAAIWAEIRRRSEEILAVDAPRVDYDRARPFVLLTIGVNGVGKTTTIGKLAALHRARGQKVLLAAGDTFRAAAVEQLEIWGQRADAPVVRGGDGADPSSVIFEAIQKAIHEEIDVVIADTAGRLHTKVDLMEELKKVRRVCAKAAAGAPHETWLVVDATNGQNAIAQAQMFKQAMDITGIVLTKLDGTAKGGVILGIADELAVPVRYIGIGERVQDLREFDPRAFVEALYGAGDADEDDEATLGAKSGHPA